METYSDESLELMRDHCDNTRDLAMIDLLCSTGIRVGELVKLNRSDVDFENRECLVFGKGNKQRKVYFDARTKIHLQRYLAEQIERIGKGAKLVRREYPTAIGPVDIMAVNAEGEHVAVEIKRHGGIDGVEQLTRYCELLNRDPLLAPVHGIFAAQTITPQAQVLAKDRGFTCLILDYDDMKGTEDDSLRLF